MTKALTQRVVVYVSAPSERRVVRGLLRWRRLLRFEDGWPFRACCSRRLV